MAGIRSPLMINGVAVVSAPAEIDISTAGQLRMVLLEAAGNGHATLVVDLTRTQLCDSWGLGVLAAAHRRALAAGGELRLVLCADSGVARVLHATTLDRFISCFPSLDQALALGAAVIQPPDLRPSRAPGGLAGQSGRPAERA